MKVTSVLRPEHAVLVSLLRDLRLEARLTQVTVAARLGISQTGVSDMEMGIRGVDYLVVRDLCDLYGMTISNFEVRLQRRLREDDLSVARPGPGGRRKAL